MASILLSSAGQMIAGPLGKTAGGVLGAVIDRHLLKPEGELPHINSKGVSTLHIQSAAYGRVIPLVFGCMRVAGNIIWADTPKTHTTRSVVEQGGGKGALSPRVQSTTTSTRITVSFAIALAEGPVDRVLRVWADTNLIDLASVAATVRFYTGDEAQLPDPAMEAVFGVGQVPAFRGVSYVVCEHFDITDFGRRIPNLTFELCRVLHNKREHEEDIPLEARIRGMVLIPGSGEHVYDTIVQYKTPGSYREGLWIAQGKAQAINRHHISRNADAAVALEQLQVTCPHLDWVAVVVAWFANSLDMTTCSIYPAVEYKEGARTEPDLWQVAGFTRATAQRVHYTEENQPLYGGTPNDAGLLRLVEALQEKGYRVALYPLLLMDIPDKPWRGRITGSPEDVMSFFFREDGYRHFILHYASLLGQKVDAFAIGSELKGITGIQDPVTLDFPAVEALKELATSCRAIVQESCLLTYAADWSEYHHSQGGWYHLDALWAHGAIDRIGIDAYFPLTEGAQDPQYRVELIMQGWESGEGYDYVYTDQTRTETTALEPEYAWKNIAWWWQHEHYNPDGNKTAWVPRSKPIWFTEYGFPSVDAASNQPNVFVDAESSESALPQGSKGVVDIRAQRTALLATELFWQHSDMVEEKMLWTWDARPFPFWPDLYQTWRDAGLWQTGHWVQGKLGQSELAAVVAWLAERAGILAHRIDTSRLFVSLHGMAIEEDSHAVSVIEALASAYGFDAVLSQGRLTCKPIHHHNTEVIQSEHRVDTLYHAIPGATGHMKGVQPVSVTESAVLPAVIDVIYFHRQQHYQAGSYRVWRHAESTQNTTYHETLSLPLAVNEAEARAIADHAMWLRWVQRVQCQFGLPFSYYFLEPGDIVAFTSPATEETERKNGEVLCWRIRDITLAEPGILWISAWAYEPYEVPVYLPHEAGIEHYPYNQQPEQEQQAGKSKAYLFELPALSSLQTEQTGSIIYAAIAGLQGSWQGAVIARMTREDHIITVAQTNQEATLGQAESLLLPADSTAIMDNRHQVDVSLVSGMLSHQTLEALQQGANTALLGEEIIQFQHAQLLEAHRYRLFGLWRGRGGTEYAMQMHKTGERFILLEPTFASWPMAVGDIDKRIFYKVVSAGGILEEAELQEYQVRGLFFRPFSVVHVRWNDMCMSDASTEPSEHKPIVFSWIRRDRLGEDWRDFVDVPLSEVHERYRLRIYHQEELRREAWAEQECWTYSRSMQEEDGIVQQQWLSGEARMEIVQWSEVVGPGR